MLYSRMRLILTLAVLENIDYQRCLWAKEDNAPRHIDLLWYWIEEDNRRKKPEDKYRDISITTIDLSLSGCLEYLWSRIPDDIESEFQDYYSPPTSRSFEVVIEVEIVYYLMKTVESVIAEITGWHTETYLNHLHWSDVLNLATLALDECAPRRIYPGFTMYVCDCMAKISEAKAWVQQQADACRNE